jgi:hypothetical protein
MGYTTEFDGKFNLNKKLDKETHEFLTKLATTRRMKRKLPPEYGIEGEFYVDGAGYAGQDREDSIVDYNKPPSTQPGLWCQWTPTHDGTAIEWDGGEKFYHYVDWIKYIIDKVLAPRGYSLSGVVDWRGEDWSDTGTIVVRDNKVGIF